MLKAILFDFGQTLVDSSQAFRQAEKQAQDNIRACLDAPDDDEFIRRYRQIRKTFHEASNLSRVAIWSAVFESFGQSYDACILRRWEDEYWQTVQAGTIPLPDAPEVLWALHQRYHLGLVSNTQGNCNCPHRVEAFSEIHRHFDAIVIAGEGSIPPKPDPLPFGECLRKLGVSSGEAVFIGDDWRVDIIGARRASIRPVWIKHKLIQRNWPSVPPGEVVVTDLVSLLKIEHLLEDTTFQGTRP